MWMTSAQAAEHLGYKVRTVYNLRSLGLLPYHRLNGKGRPVFDRDELDAYMGLDARADDILIKNELRRR